MKIAWFSPLYDHTSRELKFDNNSRAAYTTFHIVPALLNQFEIDLFYAGPQTQVTLAGGVKAPVYNYLNAALMAERSPYDLYVYLVEDSPYSGWVRHHLGLKPGIVWFHDILFQNRAPDPLSHSPWTYVIEALRSKAISLPEQEVWPETNDPYPWRETLLSLATVFSSPWAQGEYRRRVSGRRGIVQAIEGDFVATPSTTIGYPILQNSRKTNSKNIGIVGGANCEDRVSKILTAALPDQPLTWFVKTCERKNIERFLKLYPKHNLSIVSYDSPEDFKLLTRSVGLLFMLHYSLYGSLSPWLEIAQQAGVVCVVNDYGLAEYLPSSEVLKVPVGSEELWYIKEILREWQTADIKIYGLSTDEEVVLCSYEPVENLAQEFGFFINDNAE